MTLLRTAAALVAGTLFGFGLAVGGMLDPSRIRNFLDVAGDFDPSLGFVFAGAVLVSGCGYLVSRSMRGPVLTKQFDLPAEDTIDTQIIVGSALFGVGWGMVGLCPGPAVSALSMGVPAVFVFVAAMVTGMIAHNWGFRGFRRSEPAPGVT